jgi:hypothetical protein
MGGGRSYHPLNYLTRQVAHGFQITSLNSLEVLYTILYSDIFLPFKYSSASKYSAKSYEAVLKLYNPLE